MGLVFGARSVPGPTRPRPRDPEEARSAGPFHVPEEGLRGKRGIP